MSKSCLGLERGSIAALCRMLGERATPLYLRTHHLQEVEPDVEAKAKAAIKAQKKRKNKAAVEVEGCGEPSTEPALQGGAVAPLYMS